MYFLFLLIIFDKFFYFGYQNVGILKRSTIAEYGLKQIFIGLGIKFTVSVDIHSLLWCWKMETESSKMGPCTFFICAYSTSAHAQNVQVSKTLLADVFLTT